jgi:hypothetical protein
MAKHEYVVELKVPDRVEHDADPWFAAVTGEGMRYCEGWLSGHRNMPGPRLEARLRRSDGKIIDTVPAIEDVTIGMVAGWPSWHQYARAAKRALVRASDTAMRVDETRVDTGGRLASLAIDLEGILKSEGKAGG